MVEYTVLATVLASVLFFDSIGGNQSVVDILIQTFRTGYKRFSDALSIVF